MLPSSADAAHLVSSIEELPILACQLLSPARIQRSRAWVEEIIHQASAPYARHHAASSRCVRFGLGTSPQV